MIVERETVMKNGVITDVYGFKFPSFGEFYEQHYGRHGIRLVSVQKFIVSYFNKEEFLYTFWVEVNE